jgi:wyosine [tRNA(Phe)-imidazoG37] synthetase (radical SAM superfamily)
MLWKNILYGPVFSRRLGYSLGINIMPMNRKICNFNCIYCECGLNEKETPKEPLPSLEEYEIVLRGTLINLKKKDQKIDHLTFSGNGEPTLHPDFDKIIDCTVKLRSEYYPNSKIAVLTNSITTNKEKIVNTLKKVDLPICKLDAGSEKIFQLINQPVPKITLDEITDRLCEFQGNLYIQTIFLKGKVNGEIIDNFYPEEVERWITRLKKIKPRFVMLYSLDRTPPFSSIEKVDENVLASIAELVKKAGFKVEYYI